MGSLEGMTIEGLGSFGSWTFCPFCFAGGEFMTSMSLCSSVSLGREGRDVCFLRRVATLATVH